MSHTLNRRDWLRQSLVMTGLLSAPRVASAARSPEFPPTRVITRAPGHHWFGYYDKLQFDPTDRYVLGMRTSFEHRTPRPDDVIEIGMVDLADGDRWIDLGESRAWNWQQGCMLQWLPGSDSTILWNDRDGDRFVCHLLDVATGRRRTIPHAIYSVHPAGTLAVAPDFSRIADVRPGYGYAGLPDPHADDLAPTDSGIFHIDLRTGASKLILSLADLVRHGPIPDDQLGVKHYFNHLLFNPDGSRFIALHRWRYPDGRRLTRLITANPDGTDVRIVIPNGYASPLHLARFEHISPNRVTGSINPSGATFSSLTHPAASSPRSAAALDPAGHTSYLPGGEMVFERHLPQRSSPPTNASSLPRRNRPTHRPRPFPRPGIHRRMARRTPSPPPEPQRPTRLHRLPPSKPRPTTPPDRHQRISPLKQRSPLAPCTFMPRAQLSASYHRSSNQISCHDFTSLVFVLHFRLFLLRAACDCRATYPGAGGEF